MGEARRSFKAGRGVLHRHLIATLAALRRNRAAAFLVVIDGAPFANAMEEAVSLALPLLTGMI